MPYEKIKDLIEQFSCELVFADSKEANSLSGLLPLLKHLHTQCMKASLKSEAKEIIRARNLINEGIRINPANDLQQIIFLETFVSDLSASINETSEKTNQMMEIEEKNKMENDADNIHYHYDEMENISDTKPIEEGLVLLKSILSHLKRGEMFTFDYSDVLELFEIRFSEDQQPNEIEPSGLKL